jgi:hypothetical protein
VLFDEHDLSASFVHDRRRDVALAQERIHHANPSFQDQLLSDGLDGRDLIGVVVHGVLGQCHAYRVRQRR